MRGGKRTYFTRNAYTDTHFGIGAGKWNQSITRVRNDVRNHGLYVTKYVFSRGSNRLQVVDSHRITFAFHFWTNEAFFHSVENRWARRDIFVIRPRDRYRGTSNVLHLTWSLHRAPYATKAAIDYESHPVLLLVLCAIGPSCNMKLRFSAMYKK